MASLASHLLPIGFNVGARNLSRKMSPAICLQGLQRGSDSHEQPQPLVPSSPHFPACRLLALAVAVPFGGASMTFGESTNSFNARIPGTDVPVAFALRMNMQESIASRAFSPGLDCRELMFDTIDWVTFAGSGFSRSQVLQILHAV